VGLLVILLVALSVALWIAALAAPLSAAGRFRTLVAAVVLSVILCAGAIGWPWTLGLTAAALWIAAIAAEILSQLA
jgi:hypothetical protein